MNTFKKYETERLILEPTTEKDAEFIFELFNTPKWIKFIGDRNIHSIEDARDYIKVNMLPQRDKLGYSTFSIVRKEDYYMIGLCGLFDREGVDGIDIGFAILPDYERKGYTYEAVNELKNIAFIEFGLDEIKAITTKDNISSQNLLEKLGLTLHGTTKLPDENKELFIYKLTRLEYFHK